MKLETPFVFLHLSKCAGTSLISQLGYLGYTFFSIKLPATLQTASPCSAGLSAKCCWWRERLQEWRLRPDDAVKLLTVEPANDVFWFDDANKPMRSVEPGFDAARDFCGEDLAYMTVLRPPVARLHSHLCEVGVTIKAWQDPLSAGPGNHYTSKRQLRDNYYVRSLGGQQAWDAPEGGLNGSHLLLAARTLARFDVVMTVASLSRDAPVQMARVGLPNHHWSHSLSRSREENLERAQQQGKLQTAGQPSCDVPPTAAQLESVVASCAWDHVLHEFASVLAARRTEAYSTAQ